MNESPQYCKICKKEYDPIMERDIIPTGLCIQCRIDRALSECHQVKLAVEWTQQMREAWR